MELSSRATKVQSEIYSGQSNNSRTVDVHSSLVNMSPSIETGNTDSENFSEHRDYVVLNQRPSPAPVRGARFCSENSCHHGKLY